MSVSLPPVLGAGDRVRFGGQVRVVTRLDAEGACLDGAARAVPLAELFADPGFAVLSAPRPAPLSPEGLLECLPARVAEHARWLEVHVAEVVTGVPAGAGPGTVPRQGYDPQVTTLRQREITKAAELRDAGHAVPLRTLQRLRQRYETQGVWGLADQRRARGQSLAGRVDERVADAVQRAVAEQVGRSTGGGSRRHAGWY